MSSISEPSASFNLAISASFCADVLLLKSSVHEETAREGVRTVEPSLRASLPPPQPLSRLPSLPSCPSLASGPSLASSSPDPPCLPPDPPRSRGRRRWQPVAWGPAASLCEPSWRARPRRRWKPYAYASWLWLSAACGRCCVSSGGGWWWCVEDLR